MNKVLIIDDEEITRNTFSEVLRSYHFSTREACDGRSGIGIFEKEVPDAVLLDLMMPGMDGIETMQEMRKIDPDVPVIFVTAHSHIPSAVEAIKKGAYDFIVKPPNYKMLVHAVNRAVEQRRVRRESAAVGAQLLETQAANRQLEREITARKQAEKGLRQSEERLRLQFESMPLACILFDTDLVILDWNTAAERIFGFRKEEVIGKNPFGLIVRDSVKLFVDDFLKKLKLGNQTISGVNENVTKDGRSIFCQWHDTPVWDESGSLIGFMGMAEDITEHKRAEEALRASEERYRILFEAMDEGFCVIEMINDPSGKAVDYRFVEINPAFMKQTGLTDALNKTMREMVPNHDEHWFEILGKVARTGEAIRFQNPAVAMQRYYDVFAFPVGGDGSQLGVIFNDITGRKFAEAALERYALEMKKLSSRLVHLQETERRHLARELHDEIGQTLTGIKLNLEGHSSLPGKKTTSSLDEAQKMVSDLMVRVRDMSLGLRPSMLDDLGLLPTLLWHFRRYTAQTNIHLTFKHSCLDCRFEPQVETAVYRVVQEALTNVARHASTDKAEVLLLLEDDALEIYVHDSGKGFDPGAAFARGDAAGLSGMRERAELLGGLMTIKSAPGAGTSLTVRIPLREQSQQKPSEDA